MPDASKAKARRRAAAAREVENLKVLKEYADQCVTDALDKQVNFIPEGFRKIAESDDMFTRTRVSAFFDSASKTYYFRYKEDDFEKTFGPFNKRNLQTLTDVLRDVLSGGPHPYIE